MRSLSKQLWLWFAALVVFVPPVLLFTGNLLRGPDVFRLNRNVDEATGPLFYLVCESIAIAIVALIAVAIRKRSIPELAKLAGLVGSGAFVTSMISLGTLLTLPTAPTTTFEPTPVINRTKFAKIYYEYYGVTRPSNGEYVMRRAVQMDEYGIQSINKDSLGWRPWQLWEEYGLPMRCFRSTFVIETPRPPKNEVVGLIFSEIIPRLEFLPIPFLLNTIFYTVLILALPRIPIWIIRRRRKQEGRCINCGYILKDLPRCPECGTPRVRRGA